MNNTLSFNRRIAMWLCGALFFGFQFLLRVAPSGIAGDLMADFKIDNCTLGALVSFYYYGYGFMQVPAGILLDRIGVRKILTLATVFCACGGILFSIAEFQFLIAAGRFAMGVGSAFAFLSCLKIISLWFTPQRFTTLVGLTLAIGMFGATFGGGPITFAANLIGWRSAVLFLAIAVASLAIIVWFTIRDQPKTSSHIQPQETVFTSLINILKNPQTWLYGAYGFLSYAPLSGFADLWCSPFMISVFGVDKTEAANTVSYFYIGIGVGAPVWSWVVTIIRSYRITLFLSAILSLITLSIIIFYPYYSYSLVPYLFFMTGLFIGGEFVAFAGITEINPKSRSATASGVHNMLCMSSGFVMQPLIGYLIDYSHSDATNIGYTLSDYQIALSPIFICMIIAGVIVYFIKESYPKGDDRKT